MSETITLLFTGLATLLILLSLPLKFNKVKPNWLYGFRTPTTVSNPDVWYAINRKTANQTIILALVMIAVAVGLYYYGALSDEWLIGINSALAFIGLTFITIKGILKARKLALE